MKKVLFVGRQLAGEKNDVVQLAQAVGAAEATLNIEYGFFEEVVIKAATGNVSVQLRKSESVINLIGFETIVLIGWSHSRIYTDLAAAIAKFAASQNIQVWNSELINARSMTKVSQMVVAALNHVTIPKTVFSLNSDTLKTAAEAEVGYPHVLKDSEASRGRWNFLINSQEELDNKLSEHKRHFMVQEYIENDHFDYRILVAGGEPVLCIKRKGTDKSHLNNISSGAVPELVDLTRLPHKLIKDSVAIAKLFHRELCGLDFIENKKNGELIFLEINLTPQIVNGVYIEEKARSLSKALMKEEK